MAGEEWREGHTGDRLPWLETAEEDYHEGTPLWRIVLLVLLGLAVIAAIIFAVYRAQHGHPADGNGQLINAQEGDYKVKPENPGGSNVSGEGESAIAASQGKDESAGAVDVRQAPEAPITAKPATAPARPVAAAKKVETALPSVARTSGGAVVQLGSFPSEGAAKAAWASLSRRYGYIAPLGEDVTQARVNGATVYRLRVNAGSAGQAGEICAKLTAAHQPCYIPHD